jgi:hypothetical protein
MAAYRCKDCTLMRCDAPNQSCAECLGNMSSTAPSLDPRVYVYSIDPVWMFGTPIVPPAAHPAAPPPMAPAPTHAITIPPSIVKKYLGSLPREAGAGIMRDWIHDSFAWGVTSKGGQFWLDVWKELDAICGGRAP